MTKKLTKTQTGRLDEKDLKAFLFTFYVQGIKDPRSIVIVAYAPAEANKLFIKWATDKNKYDVIYGVVSQRLRKSKKNNRFFTLDFYKREQRLIYEFDSDLKALLEAELKEERELLKEGE